LGAYDVKRNADVFFRDVPDGCAKIEFGRVGRIEKPLVVVGGNCSIQGFDETGTEQFWTVTGDNVSALALIDVDEDGQNELLVGSEDFQIRIFQNETVLSECQETAQITHLCGIRYTRYGFGLANGSIGVYEGEKRLWRHKFKSTVGAIQGFDLDGDGMPELIAGWANGRLEVRSEVAGELIFKDNLGGGVAGIVRADYRSDGRDEIICVSESGEIRGFLPADAEMRAHRADQVYASQHENALEELMRRKEEYLAELRTYEEAIRKAKSGEGLEAGAIPQSLKITHTLTANWQTRKLELLLRSSYPASALIKTIIVSAEGLFAGENYVTCLDEAQSEPRIDLPIRKDIAVDAQVEVLVGGQFATKYSVVSFSIRVPHFASFAELSATDGAAIPLPSGFVRFRCAERANRIVLWLRNSFLCTKPHDGSEEIDFAFRSLRSGKVLKIVRSPTDGGVVTFYMDDMAVVGDILQDFVDYMKLTELESEAVFPVEMDEFKKLLVTVDEKNAARMQLSAGMADSSQQVKQMLVAAEDSRLLGDIPGMGKVYSQLMVLNRGLMQEYEVRANNHMSLLSSLKDVNQMIQNAARMRAGQAKTRVVAQCRAAIKNNKIQELFRIIRYGASAE
jgi:Bardet-Biedl syndrome 2 protein